MSDLVSIIVPVYNVEQFLPYCIDSILSQTYLHFELLLIDDGSTDSSGKICDEYALRNNRIRVFHGQNRGVCEARNEGLREFQGEWLFFCDADDVLTDPHCIEIMVGSALKEQVDVVRSDYMTLDEQGNISTLKRNDKNKTKYSGKVISPSIFIQKIINGEFFSCFTLIRSKVVRDNRILFCNNFAYYEDMVFWLCLLPYLNKCLYLPQLFYGYRKYPGSVSYRHTELKIKNMISVIRVVTEKCDILTDAELKNLYLNLLVYAYKRALIMITADFYNQKETVIIDNDVEEIRRGILAFCQSKNFDVHTWMCRFKPSHTCLFLYIKFHVLDMIYNIYHVFRQFVVSHKVIRH